MKLLRMAYVLFLWAIAATVGLLFLPVFIANEFHHPGDAKRAGEALGRALAHFIAWNHERKRK